MGEGSRELWAELETWRRLCGPARDSLFVRYSVKGRVHFNSGEATAIETQEISLAASRRIEVSDPALVRPDRTAEEEVPQSSHAGTIAVGERRVKAECEGGVACILSHSEF